MTWINLLQLQRDLRIQEWLWALSFGALPAPQCGVSVHVLQLASPFPFPPPPTSPNSDPLSVLPWSDWPLLCGTPSVRFPDRCLNWGDCWEVSPYNKVIGSFKSQAFQPFTHLRYYVTERLILLNCTSSEEGKLKPINKKLRCYTWIQVKASKLNLGKQIFVMSSLAPPPRPWQNSVRSLL